jgi:hypothetical protein
MYAVVALIAFAQMPATDPTAGINRPITSWEYAQLPDSVQRQIIARQEMQRQARWNDPSYRRWAGLDHPRPTVPTPPQRYIPSYSQMYFRGPGGEIVPYNQLPQNSRQMGYRFMGNFSPTSRNPH